MPLVFILPLVPFALWMWGWSLSSYFVTMRTGQWSKRQSWRPVLGIWHLDSLVLWKTKPLTCLSCHLWVPFILNPVALNGEGAILPPGANCPSSQIYCGSNWIHHFYQNPFLTPIFCISLWTAYMEAWSGMLSLLPWIPSISTKSPFLSSPWAFHSEFPWHFKSYCPHLIM